MIDLTVLTPSIPERREWLKECMDSVQAQTVPVTRHVVSVGQIPAVAHQNLLLKNVETDWFCFLADDDSWAPNFVERVQECVELAPYVRVWSPWTDVHSLYNQHIFSPDLLKLACNINGGAVVDSGLLEYFDFPEYSGHDWAVWHKVVAALEHPTNEIGYITEPLYRYRLHPGQISRTDQTDTWSGLPEEFK